MQVINKINIKQNEKAYESDEDLLMPKLKSCISSPSTVASPLLSPSRCEALDTDEEDEHCLQFEMRGFCNSGEACECEHRWNGSAKSNSFILKNYPEMLLGIKSRRIASFLQ